MSNLIAQYEELQAEIENVPSCTPASFVFETPLYEQVKIEGAEARSFFEDGLLRVDGHCTECGGTSLFHSSKVYEENPITGSTRGQLDLMISLICQRDPQHEILIYVTADWSSYYKSGNFPIGQTENLLGRFIKVGQKPSHADIANGGLHHFKSVLDKTDRREIIRANGLAAHGVNIGAFVYLRRVLERMLTRAFARTTLELSENDFKTLKVKEKIEALSSNLPSFIVENKEIYGVLSKGIHSLDEEECANLYELLRSSCLLILEQERELSEKEKLTEQLSKAIKNVKFD